MMYLTNHNFNSCIFGFVYMQDSGWSFSMLNPFTLDVELIHLPVSPRLHVNHLPMCSNIDTALSSALGP